MNKKIEELKEIAEEMYQSIKYTLNYNNREDREENDYNVSFLYPANNLSYQKLLKSSKAFKAIRGE